MTRQFQQDWQELAAAAQKGDKRAYHTLLQQLVPYIRNVLSGSLSDADAVEVIVQETLLSVHKSLKTYSPDLPFKPWLLAIVNFRRTDYLRKYYAGRQDRISPVDVLEFSDEHVTTQPSISELGEVELALSRLPERQRRIFRMIKIEGFSAQEVANEMGMNVSAVKVSAHRTLKKLREELGND